MSASVISKSAFKSQKIGLLTPKKITIYRVKNVGSKFK